MHKPLLRVRLLLLLGLLKLLMLGLSIHLVELLRWLLILKLRRLLVLPGLSSVHLVELLRWLLVLKLRLLPRRNELLLPSLLLRLIELRRRRRRGWEG